MKITNHLLEQYVSLETQIKALEKEYDAIKIILKEAGSCSTSDYVVAVDERETRRLPGVEEMVKLLGAELVLPCVKTSVSKYVKVSMKSKAKKEAV